MHGNIEVTSRWELDLCLSLPFLLRLQRNREKKDEVRKYNIRGLHLLAAEDNELNAEM